MKNILFLLVFIPLISFGQDSRRQENTTKVVIKKTSGKDTETGFIYLGDGLYQYGRRGAGMASMRGQEKKALKAITEFAANENKKYRIKSTEKLDVYSGWDRDPFVKITFELLNEDGSLVLTKDDARRQLLELKNFLDLGIITQEEFDKKSISLKKILLGN